MTESRTRVLVLGAYGFFGSRIAAGLARNPRVQLILAGRDLARRPRRSRAQSRPQRRPAAAARRQISSDARLALLLAQASA